MSLANVFKNRLKRTFDLSGRLRLSMLASTVKAYEQEIEGLRQELHKAEEEVTKLREEVKKRRKEKTRIHKMILERHGYVVLSPREASRLAMELEILRERAKELRELKKKMASRE
jgi:DNA repair exonuclease SbcCD ATPase subunit